MCTIVMLVLFFKQKTAYELRIRDWSSDVCSSDLHGRLQPRCGSDRSCSARRMACFPPGAEDAGGTAGGGCRGKLGDRKSVVWGKSVAVRVDIGGGRISKTKTSVSMCKNRKDPAHLVYELH